MPKLTAANVAATPTLALPLHNAIAERRLIACILREPLSIGAECRELWLEENPFVTTLCKLVYSHFLILPEAKRENAFMAIAEALQERSADIMGLYEECVTIALYGHVMETVRDAAIKRKVISIYAHANVKLKEEDADVEDILTKVTAAINESDRSPGNDDIDDKVAAMDEAIAIQSDPSLWNKTYMTGLDTFIGNVPSGSYCVCAARPGVGKTIFACQVAYGNASAGNPVGFISLEMSTAQLQSRFISLAYGINSQEVLPKLVAGELAAERKEVEELPIYFSKKRGVDVDYIESLVKTWYRKYGIRWLIIDHFGLLRTKGSDRVSQLSEASNRLKVMCGDLGIVLLNLSQFNRGACGNIPELHHLKGTGSIEEDADMVFILHSEEPTDEETASFRKDGSMELLLKVAKNRHGQLGLVRSQKQPQYSRILTDRITPPIWRQHMELTKGGGS